MIQANQLTTLNSLKQYLNWSLDDVSFDDFFNDMINSVSNCIEQFCNTKIKQCVITEKTSGHETVKLYLSNRPITDVSSIKYWDGNVFAEYMTVTDIQKYIVLSDHSIYNRAEVFHGGLFNYEVTYTAGFDQIPPDLKLVAEELCAIFFKNSFLGDGRIGLISNQQGNFKMFFLDQLPYHKRIIDKYKLINV